MRYTLDASCRRIDSGRVLIGGSPVKVFRLSDRGITVIDAVATGESVPEGAAVDRLLARLVDAGAVHPVADQGPYGPGDVTVVVPALAVGVDDLGDLLGSLGPGGDVVIVDDGSSPPIALPTGDRDRVRLVRRERNGGPAAARNTGLAEVRTPLVAFIDADTRPRPGWLDPLLGHFGDPAVALAAPRVRSAPGAGVLARYESARSPLDLGSAAGRVAARTRIGYVPAAAVVARTEVIRDLGGFDDEMRVGEDVDLVWRTVEAGHRVRYEPAACVTHQPRPDVAAWLRQRAVYGGSAGPLARRHAGAAAPVAVSGWSAAAWLAAAAGHPFVGAGVAGGSALALARKLRGLNAPVIEALRIAGPGHLFAGRQLAQAITRAWWPVALAAVLASRRARRAILAAALVPAVVDWWHETGRRDLDLAPIPYVALRLLDDGAYAAGLWRGAVAARTVDTLLPDLTSWPRPSRYEREGARGRRRAGRR